MSSTGAPSGTIDTYRTVVLKASTSEILHRPLTQFHLSMMVGVDNRGACQNVDAVGSVPVLSVFLGRASTFIISFDLLDAGLMYIKDCARFLSVSQLFIEVFEWESPDSRR